MITRQELIAALDAYTRDTGADVDPADHPAVRALLDRLPERHQSPPPYGVQIGHGNSQTNVWGRG